jgi:antitoxin MazE
MRARVSNWGNSLAIRLPRAAMEALRVRAGEFVELTVDDGEVVIRPARPRYSLDELLAGITPDNQPETVEFPPVGAERL